MDTIFYYLLFYYFFSHGINVMGLYFTHNIRLGWCYFTIGISLQHQHNVILDIKGEYELRTLKGVVTTYPGWITPSHCKKRFIWSDLIWSDLLWWQSDRNDETLWIALFHPLASIWSLRTVLIGHWSIYISSGILILFGLFNL